MGVCGINVHFSFAIHVSGPYLTLAAFFLPFDSYV